MATETGEETPEEDAPLGGDTASDTGTDEAGESDEAYDQFTRSVLVTTCATLLGLGAGIASTLFATETVGSTPQPDNLLGVAILMAAVFVQFPLYSVIGLEPEDFGTKTQLYVFAMTFFMWFISWTVLLTTRGLL